MELVSAPVAAGTLVVLWSFEAFVPGIIGRRAGLRQRLRHLLIGLANAGVSAMAVFPLLWADTTAASHGFGLLRWLEAPWWLHFLIALLLLDLWQYLWHLLAHHAPMIWRFHAVHHNADRMEATVAMRFHSIEIAVQCLATIPLAVLLGISIDQILAYQIILLPVSLFHHSNIRLNPGLDQILRLLIVTPRMHWLHHSRWQPETNSNYSSVLSVWDRLFGTMRSRKWAETVDFGLDGHEPEHIETLKGMLSVPFEPVRTEFGQEPSPEQLEPDAPLLIVPISRASGRGVTTG